MKDSLFKFERYHLNLFYYFSLIALFLITLNYAYQILISSQHLFSTDFYKFYQSAHFYLNGQNIYNPIIRKFAHTNTSNNVNLVLPSDLNPPFFIMLLIPLANLSYANALLLWSFISFISTVSGILLVIKSYPAAWQNKTIRLWALAALLIYFPCYANFYLGQVSGLLLLITAAAWFTCRSKKEYIAGFLLGFAFSIKLFFGLFLLFFLLKKQWRAFIIMLATFACCGFSALWFFSARTYMSYFNTLQQITWYGSHWNASIFGFLFRTFSGNLHNIRLFYIIIAMMLIIYFVMAFRHLIHKDNINSEQQQIDQLDWQFSLTIILMLLFSPLAWLYYFMLLLIPYLTAIRLNKQSTSFNVNFCLLITILFLTGSPNNYIFPIDVVRKSIALTGGNYYFYALLLLLGLFILIGKQFTNRLNKNLIPKNISQFNPQTQLLLYALAVYPSFLIFAFAKLAMVG